MAWLLWHCLAESAEKHPHRPAIQCGDTVLSYSELDQAGNRLAHLLADAGIGRDCRVAMYLPKSERCIVAMQGISKSGAAYVPIDPAAPPRRAAYILEDCGVSALITTSEALSRLGEFLPQLDSLKMIVLAGDHDEAPPCPPMRIHNWGDLDRFVDDRPPVCAAVESDPAYLLYTSGSTGNPKGVILSHRHALTFIEWGVETFDVGPEDRLSSHAPLHFDLSVFDVYVALRGGACIVPVPDKVTLFPMEQARWIDEEKITVWYSVPSALVRMLLHGKLDRHELKHLRAVLFAGEVFPTKHLRDVMDRIPRAEFYNLYGPTETNVCTYYHVPADLEPDAGDIPIGNACANADVFAVTDSGRSVEPGQEGELYVRGPLLMSGYWGLPEKTAEVLTSNALQTAFSELVYRTGDIVRLQPDGGFTFVGRRDHMVKSRGYRIELGEIEQVLHQHDKVKEAVVLAVPDELIGVRLRAVVVPLVSGQLKAAELRAFCLAHLPKYMTPEGFEFMAELPRTSTGKADRVLLSRSVASA